MKNPYNDIRSRLGTPVWWDEVGCPRYCEFDPREASDIYCEEVALLEIACQACGKRFLVAMSCSKWDEAVRSNGPLRAQIKSGSIHYGDPPNAGCCAAGPTMNCVDIRVVEYWHNVGFDWSRDQCLQIDLPDAARAAKGQT